MNNKQTRHIACDIRSSAYKAGIFRVDADGKIGIGHFTRSLVLAEALVDSGVSVTFIMTTASQWMLNEAGKKKVGVIQADKGAPQGSAMDLSRLTACVKGKQADLLVLDGNGFGKDYIENCGGIARKLLVIQDIPVDCANADIIVNQNPCEENHYNVSSGARLLLGTKYCLVDGKNERAGNSSFDKRARILLTLGGADVKRLTLSVAKTLATLDADVDVVIGPASEWASEDFADIDGSCDIHMAPAGLDKLIAAADVGVMAMGGTTWNMCFRGLPFIMLPCIDEQEPLVRWFSEKRLAVKGLKNGNFDSGYLLDCIKPYLDDVVKRRNVSQKLLDLVDGKGAQRVLREIKSLFSAG